jgi:hypothetical protein
LLILSSFKVLLNPGGQLIQVIDLIIIWYFIYLFIIYYFIYSFYYLFPMQLNVSCNSNFWGKRLILLIPQLAFLEFNSNFLEESVLTDHSPAGFTLLIAHLCLYYLY